MEGSNEKNYQGGDEIKKNKLTAIVILIMAFISVGGVLFFIFADKQVSTQEDVPIINQQSDLDLEVGVHALDIDDVCSISSEPVFINFCYINAAVDQRNVDLCKKIPDDFEGSSRAQKNCEDMINERLAHEKKDVKYCLKLDSLNYNLRDCVTMVAELTGDESVCKYWPKGLVIETCKEYARTRQAINTGNKEICDMMESYKKSDCYGKLGVIKNDLTLCDLAESDKERCYGELAIMNVDQKYCQGVYEGNEKYCIEDVNTIKESFKKCILEQAKNECLMVASEIINDVEDCRMVNDETAYYPIALKNCYFRTLTKCEKMSSEVLKEECKVFVYKKYNHEREYGGDLAFYEKQ